MKFITPKLSPEDVKVITKFADNNLKVVKFVPEQNTVLNKDLKRDFYGLVPVLEFRSFLWMILLTWR